jgi:hypothetical protein
MQSHIQRALIIFAGLTLASFGVHDARLRYWRAHAFEEVPETFTQDPKIIIVHAAHDPQFLTRVKIDPALLEQNALAVLRSEPLSPEAFYVLGIAREQMRTSNSIKEFQTAELISRREPHNELALAIFSAKRGDIQGTVSRLDRAFSVSPDVSQKYIPILAPSLNEPIVAKAFVKFSSRPWFLELADAGVGAGVAPAQISGMLDAAERSQGLKAVASYRSRLLSQILARGDFSGARAELAKLAQMERKALESFNFTAGNTDPNLAPMAWSLANDAAKSANLSPDGSVQFSIAPEQTGTLAERLTLLEPGSYLFMQRLSYDADNPKMTLVWDATCEGSVNMPIWHQSVPRRVGRVTYQSRLSIPTDCPIQHWRLQAIGETAQSVSRVSLEHLTLARK